MQTRSLKKGRENAPAKELDGIDRVFGRDLRSRGWVVDLNRVLADADTEVDVDYRNQMDDDLDPAMIWVMRGRRR